MSLDGQLRTLVQLLHEARAEFALVGGLAVGARVDPRFTRDVDVVVAVDDDDQAEALISELGTHFRPLSVLEHRDLQRLSTARLASTHLGEDHLRTVIDLIFASSAIEAEIVAAAEPVEVFSGLELPVATIGHLIALKLLSTRRERPQDVIDIEMLRQKADRSDIASAREAVGLITSRGANRGRDLTQMLDELLQER